MSYEVKRYNTILKYWYFILKRRKQKNRKEDDDIEEGAIW